MKIEIQKSGRDGTFFKYLYLKESIKLIGLRVWLDELRVAANC